MHEHTHACTKSTKTRYEKGKLIRPTAQQFHPLKTKVHLFCQALLLTEDNHLPTASHCYFGTPCVSMSAFLRIHTVCQSQSPATPPTACPAAGCHQPVPTQSKCLTKVSGQPKTRLRAESVQANCHFLLSSYSFS